MGSRNYLTMVDGLLIDGVLKTLACLKFRLPGLRYLNGLSGSWIATGTGLASRNAESSETNEADFTSVSQRV